MSAFVAIFDLAPAQAELEQLGLNASDPGLRIAVGRAVADHLQGHFRELAGARHRSGSRFNFYLQAAKSVTQPRLETDGVTVSVTALGVAQRFFGGTITAGSNGSGKKWITIPAVPEAFGRRAGEFSNLRFIKVRPDLAMLVADQRGATGAFRAKLKGSPGAKKQRGFNLGEPEDERAPVVYWLKPSVTQAPDPTVLPSEEKLADVAARAAAAFVARRK